MPIMVRKLDFFKIFKPVNILISLVKAVVSYVKLVHFTFSLIFLQSLRSFTFKCALMF